MPRRNFYVAERHFPNRLVEPDWDAPHRRRVDLLSPTARCETCLYWHGLCGLDTTRMTRAEDRCEVYQQHPDHAEETAQRAASWKFEAPMARRPGL